MSNTTPEQNKALVLGAFDMLFNKRDYDAVRGPLPRMTLPKLLDGGERTGGAWGRPELL